MFVEGMVGSSIIIIIIFILIPTCFTIIGTSRDQDAGPDQES
jgi:hypothetical protein